MKTENKPNSFQSLCKIFISGSGGLILHNVPNLLRKNAANCIQVVYHRLITSLVNKVIFTCNFTNSVVNCAVQEDESLRRWKEKLLGCLESDLDGLFEEFVFYPCLRFIELFCSV